MILIFRVSHYLNCRLTNMKLFILLLLLQVFCILGSFSKKFNEEGKPDWAKKDIRDYSDADLERLLDQWEEDEEPLPEDELPEHLRTPPKFEFDPSNIQNPEKLLQISKKGKTLMMFVRVRGKYSTEEADTITQRWQSSLWNNHIQAERYMVDERRAIFMFKDGSVAWEAKDFMVEQEELEDCTIENHPYYGKYSDTKKEETKKSKNIKKKKRKEKEEL